MRLPVNKKLLKRYATSAPRYTSYPTAIDWVADSFEPLDYAQHLTNAANNSSDPLSVYIHIPFCAEMCLYCGCNVVITRREDRVERYLKQLETEFERVAETGIGQRQVHQYHWGGGTPTHLTCDQIRRVHAMFTKVFTLTDDAEVAIEVDPRVTNQEQLAVLAELGFNRISMGVQDFDPKVQEAVKRVQPKEITVGLVESARKLGIGSVNLDLIYGLPHQSRALFAETVKETIILRPERVALFHYAHVPWMKKHQTAMDMESAPSSEEKIEIFLDSVEAFQDAGYEYLGLDHFALPDDELAVALKNRTLHRNFMGYTTHAGTEMVSFGVSSIGEVDGCFVQNKPVEIDYLTALEGGGLAALRGHKMSGEDRLRRDVILGIMCNGYLDKKQIQERYRIDFDQHFAAQLKALIPMQDDGLVLLHAHAIELTSLGQMFMRNVAVQFDSYFAARQDQGKTGEGTFSKTL
jgi:oxygen-independent coproporphyrinogen-3 oxidase